MTRWEKLKIALDADNLAELHRLLDPVVAKHLLPERRMAYNAYMRAYKKVTKCGQKDYWKHVEKRRAYNREYQRRKRAESGDATD